MKKILVLLFITASFLIQAKDGFKIIKTDENSVTVEYTFSALEKSPVTINNKTYQKLSANNCVPVLNVGFPQVLRSSVSLAIPNNAIPKLEILSSDFTEYGNNAIAPSKGSLTRNINPDEVPYTFGNIYLTNSFYPSQFAEVNSTYFLTVVSAAAVAVASVAVVLKVLM